MAEDPIVKIRLYYDGLDASSGDCNTNCKMYYDQRFGTSEPIRHDSSFYMGKGGTATTTAFDIMYDLDSGDGIAIQTWGSETMGQEKFLAKFVTEDRVPSGFYGNYKTVDTGWPTEVSLSYEDVVSNFYGKQYRVVCKIESDSSGSIEVANSGLRAIQHTSKHKYEFDLDAVSTAIPEDTDQRFVWYVYGKVFLQGPGV